MRMGSGSEPKRIEGTPKNTRRRERSQWLSTCVSVDAVSQGLLHLVSSLGYGGVAFLMFVESIVLPVPGELIMAFAGFMTTRGQLSLPGAIIAGTIGELLGGLPWYLAGRL